MTEQPRKRAKLSPDVGAIVPVREAVNRELAKSARSVEDAALEVAGVLYDFVAHIGEWDTKEVAEQDLAPFSLQAALVASIIKPPLNFQRKFLATFRAQAGDSPPDLELDNFPEIYRAVADAMVPDDDSKQWKRTMALERHVRLGFRKHVRACGEFSEFLDRASICVAALPVLEILSDGPDDAKVVDELLWEFVSEAVVCASEEICRIYKRGEEQRVD